MKNMLLIVLASSAVMVNCNKVPFTGRQQLKLLPNDLMLSMGSSQYRDFLNTHTVVRNTADADMLLRVGSRLSRSTESLLVQLGQAGSANQFAWEFNLVRDNAANAWCMPGGKVVFYTGILPITANESGMAVVMGHEIAHAVAQHGNERMSQALTATVGYVALDIALREKPEQTRELFLLAYGVGATVGVMLPFSRKHESEADEIGLYIMAAAGYDPREAPKFWQRMKTYSPTNVPEFLSTHPSHDTRIANLSTKYMPRALRYYNQSQTNP
jgi:predicted Zn-dependent protease